MAQHTLKAEQRRAVIIGASSGIGREVARLLLADGWLLGIAARREEPLRELQQAFPGSVEWIKLDVTSKDSPAKLRQLIGELGGMELFFHASGIGKQNPSLEESTEIATTETNAVGFTRMVGEAYRYFAEVGKGHIAVVSSIAGTRGLGPSPAYSATKAMQNTYIEALEQLAHEQGLAIRFTDIRPGFIDTSLLSGARFPHTLPVEKAARSIVRAVYARKSIAYIDAFWHAVVLGMRCIPRALWRKMKLK